MAINPKLKAQLDSMTMDDAYRAKLVAALDDAPADVQNLWMAQQEFTRNINAHNEEKRAWKATADDFYTKSNTAVDAWKAEVKKATDTANALQARITELEAGGGTVRTPGQEDAAAAEIKGLRTLLGNIEAKLTGVVTKENLDGAYQSAVGFIGEQLLTLNELDAQHRDTFGKRLTKADNEAIIAHANEMSKKLGHQVSLEESYKDKFGTELKDKERETIRNEEAEKLKSGQVPNGGTGGTSTGPGGPGKGPLEIRLDQVRDMNAGKTNAGFGTWQEAAAAAADELVKEGKY